MTEFMHWLSASIFQLVESTALIGSLAFTAISLRADLKSRKAENLIRITENHRTLWLHFQDHPELSRVLEAHADLVAHPVTPQEQRFVILIILHLFTTYKTMKSGLYPKLDGVEEDVGSLFTLPIPSTCWKRVRPLQDRDFVAFVDGCIQDHAPT